MNSSKLAKKKFTSNNAKPILLCDWDDFVFIHFSLKSKYLQKYIPIELEEYEGKSYVSFVMFTLKYLRPNFNGLFKDISRIAFYPIANHRYFNVRTYVKHKNTSGIYFIKEWLSCPLACFFGKLSYSLPYSNAILNYFHEPKKTKIKKNKNVGIINGEITKKNSSFNFSYQADINLDDDYKFFEKNTLNYYLTEKYTAFSQTRSNPSSFHIWHQPWKYKSINLKYRQNNFFDQLGKWAYQMKYVGSNFSPGLKNIWMSKPNRINNN